VGAALGGAAAAAIVAGYAPAIAAIIDANVVTLITAFILFVLATAGIKGFAFTLGVGTLVSLFTAVVFTQAVLGTMGRSRLLSSNEMLGAGERHYRWRFDFMGKSRYFFAVSGVILMLGAIGLAVNQLNFGIDFESGSRLTASLGQPASTEEVRDALAPLDLQDAKIQNVENQELGDNVVQIKTSELEPGGVQRAEQLLNREFRVERDGFSSESVGPTFGDTVARSATIAIIASLLLIAAYISLRFEPKFAIPVLIALAHDLLITAGVYSLTDREVTTSTVAALLTILGFSLYDTVIVFDRIRENAPRMPRATFSQIVNRSMSEVLTRSLATQFCSALPVAALLVFGGETLKDFAFALLVGIASGTYSSIFIAAPVLVAWKEREAGYRNRRKRIIDELGYVPAYADLGPAPEEGAPERERPARKPARRAEPVGQEARRDEPVVEAEPVLEEEPVTDGAGNGHLEADEEPAPVGGRRTESDPEREALRAERAERKKQRARQKSRRKHGRSR
jgi:SecD/SecF fusion protein